MKTVPAGLPSCSPGPATPVVATPQYEPNNFRAPRAIARAVSSLTVPWREITSSGTPKTLSLMSVAYATRPPLTTSEAPVGRINSDVTNPPVSDSAHEMLSARRTRVWMSAVVRNSLMLAPHQNRRPIDVVHAGAHREDERRTHCDVSERYEPRRDLYKRQNIQSNGKNLDDGFQFSTARGRYDAPANNYQS